MSIALQQSPASIGCKRERLFDEDSPSPTLHAHAAHHHLHPHPALHHTAKRARTHRVAAPGFSHPQQQQQQQQQQAYVQQQQQAIAALLQLFPDMEEKVVTAVLADAGDSLDAAIQRLTGLRLAPTTAEEEASAVAAAHAAVGAGVVGAEAQRHDQQQHHHQQQQQQGEGAAAPATAAAAAGAPQLQPEQRHQHYAGDGAEVAAAAGPQSGEQWIDFLVAEMAKCPDLTAARVRAGGVLQHFERFVKTRSRDEAKAKLADAQRENGILKRAVQIQNTKLMERAGQEQEVAQLRHMLAQYQEQVHALELSNYSLTLHLQKATAGGGMGGTGHNPDVY